MAAPQGSDPPPLQPGHTLHRDVVLDQLWPDLLPAAAANNLRQILHHLRTALAGVGISVAMVTVSPDLISLFPGIAVDTDEFLKAALLCTSSAAGIRQYEDALACWVADPLPADAYEPWAASSCGHLRELHGQLLLGLAERYSDAGDHRAAEARLKEALRDSPHDEEVHRRLISLFDGSGRSGLALNQYEQLRELLAVELDLTPSAETESLVATIKRERARAPAPASPEVSYASTSDGVRIAFWTLGQGPPLVVMPVAPISHIVREWQIPTIRDWYQTLSRDRTLIVYDARNTGSSQRGVTKLSADDSLLDLEVVIASLHLNRVDLFAAMTASPPAILFAARRPQMVHHLMLWHGHAQGARLFGTPGTTIAVHAIENDWFIYCQLIARAQCGWVEQECTPAMSEMFLDASTPGDAKALLPFSAANDVLQEMEMVEAPTLVFHRRDNNFMDLAISQELADGIPHARLVMVEGAAGAPYIGDHDTLAAEINAFLAEAVVR